jgi:2-oxoisovalerate dehydrogenase E1 component alpha subunit
LKVFNLMNLISKYDHVMYEAQRQGRISFFMQNTGETAAQLGSAMALEPKDVVYAQYREAGKFKKKRVLIKILKNLCFIKLLSEIKGVLLWRGFTIQQCSDQIFGNQRGSCKGKQMPVVSLKREFLNFQMVIKICLSF